jgi:hypothetical protein
MNSSRSQLRGVLGFAYATDRGSLRELDISSVLLQDW